MIPAPNPETVAESMAERYDADERAAIEAEASLRPVSRARPANDTALKTIGPPEIFAPLPPVPWTVEGLGLAPGAATVLAGYGFSGKTVIAQSLALSVASGRDLWGVFRVARGRALHVDFEQGDRLTRERYQRLALGMGIDWHELQDNLRAAILPSVYLDDDRAEDTYARAFEGFSLAIVDSLRAAAPRADENSSDVRRYIDVLSRAAEKTGALVLLLHHARKPSEDAGGGSKMAVRGSSAIFDACASVFVVSANKGEATRVRHEKDRIRGALMSDFGLRIEDVPKDNEPRAGLRVVHLEAEQIAVSVDEREQQLEQRVLAAVREGGLRSSRQVYARVGGNKRVVFILIKELLEEGVVASVNGELRVVENAVALDAVRAAA